MEADAIEQMHIEAEAIRKKNDQVKEPEDTIRAEDRFHTYEVDWRNGAANPTFEFRPGTPCFDDDLDFYRTLVIMSAPTCERVEGNNVWYSTTGKDSHSCYTQVAHYTMWLPNWKRYTPGSRETVPELDTAQAAKLDTILAGMRWNDEEQPELPPATENTQEDTNEVLVVAHEQNNEEQPEYAPERNNTMEGKVDKVDEVVTQEREELESEDDSSRKGNGHKRNTDKKNAWSKDTPADGQFKNSTNYMIIEWLKTRTNYKEWKERGKKRGTKGKTQTEMIEALRNDINSVGVNRNRTTTRIGTKIRIFESQMRKAHTRQHKELLQKHHGKERQSIEVIF